MTLNRWSVVLASTVALIACDNPTAPPGIDRLNARWAGRDWVGTASAELTRGGISGDTLYLFSRGPLNSDPAALVAENHIVAKVAFRGVGTYPLGPGSARFEQWVGGDVVTATYSTSAEASGTLVITKYAGIGGNIEGTLSFDAVSTSQSRNFGERARLEDGRFRTTLQLPERAL